MRSIVTYNSVFFAQNHDMGKSTNSLCHVQYEIDILYPTKLFENVQIVIPSWPWELAVWCTNCSRTKRDLFAWLGNHVVYQLARISFKAFIKQLETPLECENSWYDSISTLFDFNVVMYNDIFNKHRPPSIWAAILPAWAALFFFLEIRPFNISYVHFSFRRKKYSIWHVIVILLKHKCLG